MPLLRAAGPVIGSSAKLWKSLVRSNSDWIWAPE